MQFGVASPICSVRGQVEDTKEHPQDWQRARDAHIQAEKQRKGAYLRLNMACATSESDTVSLSKTQGARAVRFKANHTICTLLHIIAHYWHPSSCIS